MPLPSRSTNASLDRPALTAAVMTFMKEKTAGILFGRGVANPAGGWPEGKARNGEWKDHAVLKTGPAVTPAPGGPDSIGRPRVTYLAQYQVTSHGESDSDCDAIAQKIRDTLPGFAGVITLGGLQWQVDQLLIPRLGGTERDGSTDPAHWRVTDDVSVRLSLLSR